jgi:predicted AlkP superfamily phosphohydrolase/phosphomutase
MLAICNERNDGTVRGYRQMRDDLIDQVDQKAAWLAEMVDEEAWDLVTVTFGESHCIGHHQLHHLDPSNPWHDPTAPPDVRDALPRVYEAIDRAVGTLVGLAGPGATVVVVASHGMDLYVGGYQTLDGVLRRMDQSAVGRAMATPAWLPPKVRSIARALVPSALRRRRRELSGEREAPLESPQTRAAAMHNNRVGAVRLNLRGREPHGTVEPGAEAEALIADITSVLVDLRQPGTDEPIVARVDRTDVLFGAERHPDLPDLLVVYRTDIGVIDACTSPRIGRVEAAVRHPEILRSGDHTDHARWWVRAPGVTAGPTDRDVHALDLAPTVLAALGIEPPSGLDGTALLLATTDH